jgi:thioredoxin 1
MAPPGLFRRSSRREAPPPEEWPRGSVELDGRTFRDFVEMYPLVAVEFWASWCAPCKAMRPVIRDLAKRHKGEVAIGKVNIERHRDLAEENNVLSIPHIIYFSYGKKVHESHGKLNRRTLEGRFKKLVDRYH